MNFEKYSHKANEILNELSEKLGCPGDKDKAWRILRSVLHALRNRLTVEESLQLTAQLPMYLKALYVDGWKLRKDSYKIKHIDEFLDEVYMESTNTGYYDFPNSTVVYHSVISVFSVLRMHISPGEVENIVSTLPRELKSLWNEDKSFIIFNSSKNKC